MASTNNIYIVRRDKGHNSLIPIATMGEDGLPTVQQTGNRAVDGINQKICAHIYEDTKNMAAGKYQTPLPVLIKCEDISAVIYASSTTYKCRVYHVLQVSAQGVRLTAYMKDRQSDRQGIPCHVLSKSPRFEGDQLEKFREWSKSRNYGNNNEIRKLLDDITSKYNPYYCQMCQQEVDNFNKLFQFGVN